MASLLLLPFRLWRAYIRRRQHGDRICQRCGYDVRASHLICPECGRVIPSDAGLPSDPLLARGAERYWDLDGTPVREPSDPREQPMRFVGGNSLWEPVGRQFLRERGRRLSRREFVARVRCACPTPVDVALPPRVQVVGKDKG